MAHGILLFGTGIMAVMDICIWHTEDSRNYFRNENITMDSRNYFRNEYITDNSRNHFRKYVYHG